MLELLGSDADTTLSITTDGKCLIVAPADTRAQRKRFQDAASDIS